MSQIESKPEHSIPLVMKDGRIVRRLQVFFDEIQQRLNAFLLGDAVQLKAYNVADLPPAADNADRILIVNNDATVGKTIAYSDGTNWKRPNAVANVS